MPSITVNYILDQFPGYDILNLKDIAFENEWIRGYPELRPEVDRITYRINRT